MNIISNAISGNMFNEFPVNVHIQEITKENVLFALQTSLFVSAVDHADTANLFSNILGQNVNCNRMTIQLSAGDTMIVGQYSGPRLPEGCKTLPDGASIKWLLVAVQHA